MDYIEVELTIKPYKEITADLLTDDLGQIGFDSFSETDTGIKAYIAENKFNEQALKQLIDNFVTEETINYKISTIKTENWNALWESNFEPVMIDTRCTIRAPFHIDLPKSDIDIIIEPKMAFGTGHHETTYLMAEALLDANVQDLQVLDMGCGTGILAMIAALRGAKHVDAIDNDDWATDNAMENIGINGLADKISVATGDALLLKPKQYNLIVANINRNILLEDMKYYVNSLIPKGTILMSGIYHSDIEMLEQQARQFNLVKTGQKTKNQWARVEFKQP